MKIMKFVLLFLFFTLVSCSSAPKRVEFDQVQYRENILEYKIPDEIADKERRIDITGNFDNKKVEIFLACKSTLQ